MREAVIGSSICTLAGRALERILGAAVLDGVAEDSKNLNTGRPPA